MINPNESFDRYMGTGATLGHFSEAVNVIAENAPVPLQGQAFTMTNQGTEQYKFKCSKNRWVDDGKDRNYSIHFEFTWSDGDGVIRLRLHFEIYPYSPTRTEDLPISFRRLQTAFTTELHRRLQPLWRRSNNKWQKAVCTIPADSTIRQIKEWFEEQSRIGERIIDETIESVLT